MYPPPADPLVPSEELIVSLASVFLGVAHGAPPETYLRVLRGVLGCGAIAWCEVIPNARVAIVRHLDHADTPGDLLLPRALPHGSVIPADSIAHVPVTYRGTEDCVARIIAGVPAVEGSRELERLFCTIPLTEDNAPLSAFVITEYTAPLRERISIPTRDDQTVAVQAIGLAIANHDNRAAAHEAAKQRRVILELAAHLETVAERDDRLYAILTALTCGAGIGFNRAFLFLEETEGTFRGEFAVAPKSREHLEQINAEAKYWTLTDYLAITRNTSHAQGWPTRDVRMVRLTATPGSALAESLASAGAAPASSAEPLGSTGTEIFAAARPLARVEGDQAGLFPLSCPYVLCAFPLPKGKRGILYMDNIYSHGAIIPEGLSAMGLREFLGKTLGTTLRIERESFVRSALMNFVAKGAEALRSDSPSDETFLTELREALASFEPTAGGVYRSADSKSWSLVAPVDTGPVSAPTELEFPDPIQEEVSIFLDAAGNRTASGEQPEAVFCRLLAADEGIRYGVFLRTSELPWRAYIHALENLCAFGSALRANAEERRLHARTVAKFLEHGTAEFPTRILALTGHEVRNVLQNALGCIITIRLEQHRRLTPKDRKQLEDMEARLLTDIEALAAYLGFLKEGSTLSEGGEEWSEPFAIVSTVQRMLGPRLTAAGRSVQEVINTEDLPKETKVRMKRINLTIVIYNLLANAIKATSLTPNPRIRITGSFDGSSRETFYLRFIDNGIGIHADEKNLIFKGNYSGFAKRRIGALVGNRNTASAGVGLYGVKALVESAHGTIDLNSSKDTGETVALVCLPGRNS